MGARSLVFLRDVTGFTCGSGVQTYFQQIEGAAAVSRPCDANVILLEIGPWKSLNRPAMPPNTPEATMWRLYWVSRHSRSCSCSPSTWDQYPRARPPAILQR